MNSLAVIFPGQASQRIGMLKNLAMHYSLVEETFAIASEVVGYDIWKLIQNGPVLELNKTYRAQPAILTASVAIWKIWRQQGGCIPKIMAGHSLGEYSALVCSEGIELNAAVRLVMIRGMLMQEAVPNGYGAMSVIIGLDTDVVCKLCKIAQQDQIVSPAGFNASDNIVISGHKEAVDRVNLLCQKAGAKHTFILPISVPSHCLLMQPIAKKFKKELEKITIRTPSIPIVNNTDVYVKKDPVDIRDALIRQLYTPVRWNEIVQYCINKKINKFLEMGPGKILTKLIHNTVCDVFSYSIYDSISLLKAMQINWD